MKTLNDFILEPINELGTLEGWQISDVMGSEDGGYRLERNDNNSVFCTDADAISFVYKKALLGSDIHKKAFQFIIDRSNVSKQELDFVNESIRGVQNEAIFKFNGIENINNTLLNSDKYFHSYNELIPIIRKIESIAGLKYQENSGGMKLVSNYERKIVIHINKSGNDINDYRMLITKCIYHKDDLFN